VIESAGSPLPIDQPQQVALLTGSDPDLSFNDLPLADSGLRFAGRLLDRIILALITFPVNVAILGPGFAAGGFRPNRVSLGAQLLAGLLSTTVVLLWDVVCTKQLSGSPMKRSFGMRVVSAVDRSPITWNQAFRRGGVTAVVNLIPILGGIVTFVWGCASLVLLFTDKQSQTLSDKLAGTVVVKER
jgi:uncharacterized RDD family membrane protein YckC